MSDQWTDRLSEYVDDELPPSERTALEAHLRTCVACGAVVADLRRIVARARGLEDQAPAHDLWPAISARIEVPPGLTDLSLGRERSRRRWIFSLPQLAAAGLALMALSGGAAWLLHPAAPAAVASQRLPAPGTSPVLTVAASGPTARRGYDSAVADLERVLEAGRGQLDTSTVRVIVVNLATIDSAIAQAQRAVAADSANLYLNLHLAETMHQKLELLRQAAALVSSVS